MIETILHNDSELSVNSDTVGDLSNLVLNYHGHESGKINIIVTDDDSLRKMKKEFFNENVFTDVIAFNIEDNPFEAEIYISFHRVVENAKKYNQKLENEFKRVIIHGLLHLCGHKDSTAELKGKMSLVEDNFLNEFNKSVISV